MQTIITENSLRPRISTNKPHRLITHNALKIQVRIGHFVEAQILEAIEVDYIDESEVLTMADEENHINKNNFKVPFVCGCRNLGEALRRIAEGAAMLRTKGEAGTGNIVEAVRHARAVQRDIKRLMTMDPDELFVAAKVTTASAPSVPYIFIIFLHQVLVNLY